MDAFIKALWGLPRFWLSDWRMFVPSSMFFLYFLTKITDINKILPAVRVKKRKEIQPIQPTPLTHSQGKERRRVRRNTSPFTFAKCGELATNGKIEEAEQDRLRRGDLNSVVDMQIFKLHFVQSNFLHITDELIQRRKRRIKAPPQLEKKFEDLQLLLPKLLKSSIDIAERCHHIAESDLLLSYAQFTVSYSDDSEEVGLAISYLRKGLEILVESRDSASQIYLPLLEQGFATLLDICDDPDLPGACEEGCETIQSWLKEFSGFQLDIRDPTRKYEYPDVRFPQKPFKEASKPDTDWGGGSCRSDKIESFICFTMLRHLENHQKYEAIVSFDEEVIRANRYNDECNMMRSTFISYSMLLIQTLTTLKETEKCKTAITELYNISVLLSDVISEGIINMLQKQADEMLNVQVDELDPTKEWLLSLLNQSIKREATVMLYTSVKLANTYRDDLEDADKAVEIAVEGSASVLKLYNNILSWVDDTMKSSGDSRVVEIWKWFMMFVACEKWDATVDLIHRLKIKYVFNSVKEASDALDAAKDETLKSVDSELFKMIWERVGQECENFKQRLPTIWIKAGGNSEGLTEQQGPITTFDALDAAKEETLKSVEDEKVAPPETDGAVLVEVSDLLGESYPVEGSNKEPVPERLEAQESADQEPVEVSGDKGAAPSMTTEESAGEIYKQ